MDENKNARPIIDTKWKWCIITFLKLFIPEANPDFEPILDKIDEWQIEFDENGDPIREIGIIDKRVVAKMPFKKNIGYWTDNSLTLNDFFRNFNLVAMTENEFNLNWEIELNQN